MAQLTQPKGLVSKETNKDSIARKFGFKKSEVTYDIAGSPLAGYKVIYEQFTQRSYALPPNLTGTITSLTNGILVYSGGTVDLGANAVLREEYVKISGTFTSGATLNVKNEIIRDPTTLYRWDGVLPKTVPVNSTPATTGGIGVGAWISVGDFALRNELTTPGSGLVDPTRVKISPQGNLSQVIPYFTPEQFVNTGETFKDGINDDAIQINRALNYAESLGGGVVWLSKGNYYQNTQILIPENCTLRGSGMFASIINAKNTMDVKLNSITSKNNLMYLYGAGTDHPDYTDYTYIQGVVVEDLGVNANHLGRDPARLGLPTSVQACGIKFTSVKNSRISRCFVTHALLHAFDISAMTYFNDGNPTHNFPGGSINCTIEDCYGMNSLYDDIFTCHNSNNLRFKNCVAYNDLSDPNMLWENNQHGFEIDEGCYDVLVEDCHSQSLMCGFQAKGHDTSYPAQNITFRRCYARDCAWSFQTDHRNYMTETEYPQIARGLLFDDCISQNAYNDRYMPANTTYRARAFWLRSYDGVTIRNFTIIGGNGVIDIENGTKNILIDGLIWKGVYGGVNANTRNTGLINVISNGTKGNLAFKNLFCQDPLSVPVVRCVDTSIPGIIVENVTGIGNSTASDTPCLFMTLTSQQTVRNIRSSGYSAQLVDSSAGGGWSTYGNSLDMNIQTGQVHIRDVGVANGTVHPPRIGNTYISKDGGKLYIVQGTAVNTAGTWVLVGVQT